jgi:catechol 2,3-dioxygenase
MRSDPLDVQGLLEAGSAEPVGAVQAEAAGIDPMTDVGHVHLQVSDLEKAEAFYCDLLGFEVTQRTYPGALFVSAGGYHHHLGLNIWAGRGAPRPAENAVGLLSLRVEIPDGEARTAVIERARRAGVTSTGQAQNEQIGTRVLLRDPDGNGIEI